MQNCTEIHSTLIKVNSIPSSTSSRHHVVENVWPASDGAFHVCLLRSRLTLFPPCYARKRWSKPRLAGCITQISVVARAITSILAASATIRNRENSRPFLDEKEGEWKCKIHLIDRVAWKENLWGWKKQVRGRRIGGKRRWCRGLSIPFPAFHDTVLHREFEFISMNLHLNEGRGHPLETLFHSHWIFW